MYGTGWCCYEVFFYHNSGSARFDYIPFWSANREKTRYSGTTPLFSRAKKEFNIQSSTGTTPADPNSGITKSHRKTIGPYISIEMVFETGGDVSQSLPGAGARFDGSPGQIPNAKNRKSSARALVH